MEKCPPLEFTIEELVKIAEGVHGKKVSVKTPKANLKKVGRKSACGAENFADGTYFVLDMDRQTIAFFRQNGSLILNHTWTFDSVMNYVKAGHWAFFE